MKTKHISHHLFRAYLVVTLLLLAIAVCLIWVLRPDLGWIAGAFALIPLCISIYLCTLVPSDRLDVPDTHAEVRRILARFEARPPFDITTERNPYVWHNWACDLPPEARIPLYVRNRSPMMRCAHCDDVHLAVERCRMCC